MANFVLVHGAWHGGWCWSRLTPRLLADRHSVFTPTLTGLGDRAHLVSPQVGLECHVQDVVATLDYEDLDDVILVGHSYAGLVIAGVASRRPDLIARLVFLDAFLPDDGDRGIDLLSEPMALQHREAAEQGFGWLMPPPDLGLSDEAALEFVAPRLVPQPFKPYLDRVDVSEKSLTIPSDFVECVDWVRVFQPFAERAASRGWPVHTLATGHEAMVTAPAELAALLIEMAG